MKVLDIDAESREGRCTLQREHLETEKEKLMNVAEDKDVHRRTRMSTRNSAAITTVQSSRLSTVATFINRANILLICTWPLYFASVCYRLTVQMFFTPFLKTLLENVTFLS